MLHFVYITFKTTRHVRMHYVQKQFWLDVDNVIYRLKILGFAGNQLELWHFLFLSNFFVRAKLHLSYFLLYDI